MVFDNNWVVPVLHDGPMADSVIDPVLKIEMRIGRPHQEPDEVIRELHINYDPEFETDALVRSWTQDEIATGFLRNPPQNPLRLVQSEQNRRISDLLFDARFYPDKGDCSDELQVRLHDQNLRITASLLSKAVVPVVSNNPFSFLSHCLDRCTNMHVWDELANIESMRTIRGATISRIRFVIKPEVAEELSPYSEQSFADAGNGYRLFAEREVRP